MFLIQINTKPYIVTVIYNPANIYLLKVNNRNTKKMCEIYSKLKIKHQNDVNDISTSKYLPFTLYNSYLRLRINRLLFIAPFKQLAPNS